MSEPTLEELDKKYGYQARYAFEKYFEEKQRQYVKNLLPLYAQSAGRGGGHTTSKGVTVFQIGEESEGAIAVTKSRDKAYAAIMETLADWGLDTEYLPGLDDLVQINLWVYNKPEGSDNADWSWFEYDSKHPGVEAGVEMGGMR